MRVKPLDALALCFAKYALRAPSLYSNSIGVVIVGANCWEFMSGRALMSPSIFCRPNFLTSLFKASV